MSWPSSSPGRPLSASAHTIPIIRRLWGCRMPRLWTGLFRWWPSPASLWPGCTWITGGKVASPTTRRAFVGMGIGWPGQRALGAMRRRVRACQWCGPNLTVSLKMRHRDRRGLGLPGQRHAALRGRAGRRNFRAPDLLVLVGAFPEVLELPRALPCRLAPAVTFSVRGPLGGRLIGRWLELRDRVVRSEDHLGHGIRLGHHHDVRAVDLRDVGAGSGRRTLWLATAVASTTSSGCPAKPWSLTWVASCPASVRCSTRRTDRHSSTRDLTRCAAAAVRVRQRRGRRSGGRRGCRRGSAWGSR